MLFNSLDFGLFFTIVFCLYWGFFSKRIQAKNIFLIIVSYVFYGWWDWRFLSLIIISSLVDFMVGKQLDLEENEKKRKQLLWLSVAVNLGFLGFFKYFNFFVDSFTSAFTLLGYTFEGARLNIILPVGISFYTFQTMSYTFDIYYKRMKPTSDLFGFLAFVSFFPQLVAGPIERAKHLLPQFYTPKIANYSLFRSGFQLMAWGFFKKIMIADRLAQYVDGVYGDVSQAGGLAAFIGMLFFAFQLYFDFSAYSDIAIGSARTLGFDICINFKRPYLATSFSDFWKRWHISLSSWFKDYVYIPLGGNKKSFWMTQRNVLIVFVLSGLWHGASWNFVIWGLINGLYLIVLDRIIPKEVSNWFLRIGIAVFVSLMWTYSLIFFRAATFSDAIILIQNLFSSAPKSIFEYGLNQLEFYFSIVLLLFIFGFEWFQELRGSASEWLSSKPFAIRWFVYISLVLSTLFIGSYGIGLNDSNFIYFQF